LNKQERKLIKLQSKAQDCITRKKAQKLISKSDKVYEKMTKMSEGVLRLWKAPKPPMGSREPNQESSKTF